MSCAACAASVESMLTTTKGVASASVNFANSSVLVEYESTLSPTELQNAVRSIGYDIIVDSEDPEQTQADLTQQHYQQAKQRTIGSAILTLPIFILGMFLMDWMP